MSPFENELLRTQIDDILEELEAELSEEQLLDCFIDIAESIEDDPEMPTREYVQDMVQKHVDFKLYGKW